MRRNNSLSVWNNNRTSLWPMSSFFDDFFTDSFFTGSAGMKADVRETNDSYLIDIELPGMKKEDIDISLNENILTVSAKYDQQNEEKDEGRYIRRERRSGVFRRSFSMDNIKSDSIDAKMDNGVLTITCPKLEQKVITARKIDIQ